MSAKAPVAQAMAYMLRRAETFTRFLEDGRICLTNNAAERALRGIAIGRKAWLFAGSDRGGQQAADSFNELASLHIELEDSTPLIWRALEVPTSLTLQNAARRHPGDHGLVRLPSVGFCAGRAILWPS
ncbi:hypothetical protein GCM10023158_34600 [Gluconacetobacter tumulicola]